MPADTLILSADRGNRTQYRYRVDVEAKSGNIQQERAGRVTPDVRDFIRRNQALTSIETVTLR
jgi:hypothetical protein